MPTFLQRYATPFVTGLFLVSLVSGIALFFHFGPTGFRGMHEWLSMVLILPFVLHIWKNWRPMLNYLRRAPMAIALVLSLVAALAFFYPSSGTGRGAGGPPQFTLAQKVLTGSPNEVAPLFDTTPEALLSDLAAAGFTAGNTDQPLTEIAATSGKSDAEMAAFLVGIGG